MCVCVCFWERERVYSSGSLNDVTDLGIKVTSLPARRPWEEEGRNGGKTEGRKEGREKTVGTVLCSDIVLFFFETGWKNLITYRFNLIYTLTWAPDHYSFFKNTNCWPTHIWKENLGLCAHNKQIMQIHTASLRATVEMHHRNHGREPSEHRTPLKSCSSQHIVIY